ncbi:MAG: ABC transporter substrate-binding protein, partial [Phreatobacter sp.]
MQRRQFLQAAGAALAVGTPAGRALAQTQGQKILRVAPHADLKVLDPVTVSILITRMHGMMIYETLFAWDSKLGAKPMMLADYTVAQDGLKYDFRLRDGLKFHDGNPVTSADVVASLKRWMKRDVVGRKLAEYVADLSPKGDDGFSMSLTKPYGFVEFSLGSAIGQLPVIMRRQDAENDPARPITTAVGSGPFAFVANEWISGAKVVYAKNRAYLPRSEPADGLAGARVVKVDRVEWTVMPDSATAASALLSGEIDYWDRVPSDLIPLLRRSRQIQSGALSSLPNVAMIRTNSLLPPFNNVKARQALAYATDQTDYMEAVAGDNAPWKTCDAYFVCGSTNASEAGAADFAKPNLDKARRLLAESGYKGERVVLVSSQDIPAIGQLAQVATAKLKEIGLNVDLQLYDWGTANARILKQDPVEQGGWNLYCTFFSGETQFNPLTNVAANMACDRSNWVGWPCDDQAEALRQAFIEASSDATRHDAALQLQQRLAEVQPYRILGQFSQPSAWRSTISAPPVAPVAVFWNI